MNPANAEHTFVVPAYGQSQHLRACLSSLRAQSVPSEIVVATSTPYAGLDALVSEFGARFVINEGEPGIGRDWNFAFAQARTSWVTLAHQDDIYLPTFASSAVDAFHRNPDVVLVFTGYRELVGERVRPVSPMLAIKRMLLEFGFLGRKRVGSTRARLRALRFGCPIPCPAATLRLPPDGFRFREDLRVNLDWDAWLRLARGEGAFAYVRAPLMLHRIHAVSETSSAIRDGMRAAEDREMFDALWPRPLARLLARAYSLSYESGTG